MGIESLNLDVGAGRIVQLFSETLTSVMKAKECASQKKNCIAGAECTGTVDVVELHLVLLRIPENAPLLFHHIEAFMKDSRSCYKANGQRPELSYFFKIYRLYSPKRPSSNCSHDL